MGGVGVFFFFGDAVGLRRWRAPGGCGWRGRVRWQDAALAPSPAPGARRPARRGRPCRPGRRHVRARTSARPVRLRVGDVGLVQPAGLARRGAEGAGTASAVVARGREPGPFHRGGCRLTRHQTRPQSAAGAEQVRGASLMRPLPMADDDCLRWPSVGRELSAGCYCRSRCRVKRCPYFAWRRAGCSNVVRCARHTPDALRLRGRGRVHASGCRKTARRV